MKRGKINYRASRRSFSHGATRIHPFNRHGVTQGGYVMRGGVRL